MTKQIKNSYISKEISNAQFAVWPDQKSKYLTPTIDKDKSLNIWEKLLFLVLFVLLELIFTMKLMLRSNILKEAFAKWVSYVEDSLVMPVSMPTLVSKMKEDFKLEICKSKVQDAVRIWSWEILLQTLLLLFLMMLM